MDGLKTWLLLVTMYGVCVLIQSNHTTDETHLHTGETQRVSRKRPVHIHLHNGETTSNNATDIIREEGKYFLRRLFMEYGSRDVMDLTGLKKLLGNVGYYTENKNEHVHDHGNKNNKTSELSEHHGHGAHVESGDDGKHGIDGEHHEHSGATGNSERNEHMEHNTADRDSEHGGMKEESDLTLDFVNNTTDHNGYDEHETDQSEHNVNSDGDRRRHEQHRNNGKLEHVSSTNSDMNTDSANSELGEQDRDVTGGDSDESGNQDSKEDEQNEHKEEQSNQNKEYIGLREQTIHKEHNSSEEHRTGDQNLTGHGDQNLIEHGDQNLTGHGDHNDEENTPSDHTLITNGYHITKQSTPGDHSLDKHGDHKHEGESERRPVNKSRKRNKARGKGRKARRHKKKSGRSSRTRNGDIVKRSASSVIFHAHDIHSNCLSIRELLNIFHFDEKDRITEQDFLYMSPAIIYQLDKPHCRHPKHSPDHQHHQHSQDHPTQNKDIPARVWGYSCVAVVVISLVGLLGVAVIPIMQRLFYTQLLQFLVSMAVGALTGDAMLHLLPHAIAGEVTVEEGVGSGHEHSQSIWKGMCGLAGIHFFFIVQRLLTIISGVRRKRRSRRKARMLERQVSSDGFSLARRLSSYDNDGGDLQKAVSISESDNIHEDLQPLKHDVNRKLTERDQRDEHSQHGHGHSHHDGPVPKSVSAVAWMIILGDGIHNLSDGLAIGAAFASSITGGLSTAIAVFCHELPHEIGDFAVLLKSGMSVRQAVLYNCLSSLLCFIGMLIGVALGNIHEASTWIFAGVGGMFIYISLVTMIPELTSVDSQKPLRDLLLQCGGICVGSGIMLAIAVYEKDLKTIID